MNGGGYEIARVFRLYQMHLIEHFNSFVENINIEIYQKTCPLNLFKLVIKIN